VSLPDFSQGERRRDRTNFRATGRRDRTLVFPFIISSDLSFLRQSEASLFRAARVIPALARWRTQKLARSADRSPHAACDATSKARGSHDEIRRPLPVCSRTPFRN
jgi:hypothetical protein